MSAAREHILGSIRRSLGRGALPGYRQTILRGVFDHPVPGVIPARSQGNHAARVALFRRMAEKAGAVTSRIPSESDVPHAVAEHLKKADMPLSLTAAPAVEALPWKREGFAVSVGVPSPEEKVGVTRAAFGVAESGTLILESGLATPSTLNFLPDIHFVVLNEENLVGNFEEVWTIRRAAHRPMPRTLTMITGPSRTGDIDLTLIRGAHGPRVLHILIVSV